MDYNTNRTIQEDYNQDEESPLLSHPFMNGSSNETIGDTSIDNDENDDHDGDIENQEQQQQQQLNNNNNNNNNYIQNDQDTSENINNNINNITNITTNDLNNEIQILTNRLRILFFTITLPIIPLSIILTLLTIQLFFASLTSPSCGTNHPLKLYTFVTILMTMYTPNHKSIRSWLFNYDQNRDGTVRPRGVRLYDHCFHMICVLFVYYGMVVVQSCKDDVVNDNGSIGTESICTISCPEFYNAMQRYVFVLEILFVVFILPVLCLPFVYFWIIRRLRTEEAWLRFGAAVNNNGNLGGSGDDDRIVYAKEVMKEWKDVILVPVRETLEGLRGCGSYDNDSGVRISKSESFQQVRVIEKELFNIDDPEDTNRNWNVKDWDTVKDCCICMTEFGTNNLLYPDNENGEESNNNDLEIIQTKCGHLFHKQCISGWIGGNWSDDVSISSTTRVRAQRRRCPLCREDLAPL